MSLYSVAPSLSAQWFHGLGSISLVFESQCSVSVSVPVWFSFVLARVSVSSVGVSFDLAGFNF